MKISLEITGLLEEGVGWVAGEEDPTEYLTKRILDLAGNYAWQKEQAKVSSDKLAADTVLRETIDAAKVIVKK